MPYQFRLIIICILLVINSHSHARKITRDDLGYEYLEQNEKIYISKSGSYTSEVSTKIKIINENGRDAFASISIPYNSYAQKLELISASTTNDNKKYPVNPTNIEDKPVASNIMGFDQINRLRIAFQQLKVGSIVEYHYKLEATVPDIQNHYSKRFIFGNNESFNARTINIVSELPLYIENNKLDKNYSVNDKRYNGLHTINIKQLRPQCYGNINEEGLMTSIDDYPWIKLSSDENWVQFSKLLVDGFNTVINQELPSLYNQIKQKSSAKITTIDKINEISSLLNKSIRYMGDWRTTKGKFFPRNLQEVNDTEFADCKDYTSAMVAILRSLNIKASPALVMRGTFLQEMSPKLPSIDNFNHVLVKVTDNDKIYWVDPTNTNSIVEINREDIAYRHALVLDPENPKLEFIPASTPEQQKIISIKEININNNNTVNLTSTIKRNGLAAAPLTGAMLSSSKENIEHNVLQSITLSPEDVLNYNMTLPDLSSRIIKDLTIVTTLTEKLATIKTTNGKAYRIITPTADTYTVAPDAIGSLALGSPFEINSTYIIHGINKPVDKSLDFEVDTKWFTFKRKISTEKDKLKIDFIYVNKVYAIYNEELKSKEYKTALDKLQREYIGGFAVILDS